MQGLENSKGKAISSNVQEQEKTAKELKKAPSNKENKDTFMNKDVEEHDGTAAYELEEATPQLDGDNFKLSTFIPAGFKMPKSRSHSTHSGSHHVHMPKTQSGSK